LKAPIKAVEVPEFFTPVVEIAPVARLSDIRAPEKVAVLPSRCPVNVVAPITAKVEDRDSVEIESPYPEIVPVLFPMTFFGRIVAVYELSQGMCDPLRRVRVIVDPVEVARENVWAGTLSVPK